MATTPLTDVRSEAELQALVGVGQKLRLAEGTGGTEFVFVVDTKKKQVVVSDGAVVVALHVAHLLPSSSPLTHLLSFHFTQLYHRKYSDPASSKGLSKKCMRPNMKKEPERYWSLSDLLLPSITVDNTTVSISHKFTRKATSLFGKPKEVNQLRRIDCFLAASDAAAWADGLLCVAGGERRFTSAVESGAAHEEDAHDADADAEAAEGAAEEKAADEAEPHAEKEEDDATPVIDDAALSEAVDTMSKGLLLRLKRGLLGTRCWFEVGAYGDAAPRRAMVLIYATEFVSRPSDAVERPPASNKSLHWPLSAIDLESITVKKSAVTFVVGAVARSGRKIIDGFKDDAAAEAWSTQLKILVVNEKKVVADLEAKANVEDPVFVAPSTIVVDEHAAAAGEEGGHPTDAITAADWGGIPSEHEGPTDSWFTVEGATANALGTARLIPIRDTPAAEWFNPEHVPLLPSLFDLRRILGVGPGLVSQIFEGLDKQADEHDKHEMTSDEFVKLCSGVLHLEGKPEAQGG